MLMFRNIDELFNFPLPGKNWIAANHACACNLDKDNWAPANWNRENCARTGLVHPRLWNVRIWLCRLGRGKRTRKLLNNRMLFGCHIRSFGRKH